MKTVYLPLLLSENEKERIKQDSANTISIHEQLIQKLSIEEFGLTIFESVKEAHAHLNQQPGLIYTLEIYHEETPTETGYCGDSDNPDLNADASDIKKIKQVTFFDEPTEEEGTSIPYFQNLLSQEITIPQIQSLTKDNKLSAAELKLYLLDAQRILRWFAISHHHKEKSSYDDIFEAHSLFKKVEALATVDSTKTTTLNQLQSLLFMLQAFIFRLDIDGRGKYREEVWSEKEQEYYKIPADKKRASQEEFNHEIETLMSEYPLSNPLRKLAYSLLAISLILPASAVLLGLAPLSTASIATAASLALSYGFFSWATKGEPREELKEAMINIPQL